jgi:hypothetical protein
MAVSAALSVPSAVFEGGSKVKKIAIALVLGAMFAVGCGDKGADGAKSGAAASGSAKADAKSGGGETGIAECDDYIKSYSACIDKMPDAAKEPSKKALEDMKTGWKAGASGPGKDAIVTACKQAAEAMKANPACK